MVLVLAAAPAAAQKPAGEIEEEDGGLFGCCPLVDAEPGAALELRAAAVPTVRFAAGLSHRQDGDNALAMDVSLGLRRVSRGGRRLLQVVPEIGYGWRRLPQDARTNVATAGGSVVYGYALFGAGPSVAVVAGRSAGQRVLGVRSALRLEALLGYVGVEIGHQWLRSEAGIAHAVELAISCRIDVFGWLFAMLPAS